MESENFEDYERIETATDIQYASEISENNIAHENGRTNNHPSEPTELSFEKCKYKSEIIKPLVTTYIILRIDTKNRVINI